jgi:hypothetical protein
MSIPVAVVLLVVGLLLWFLTTGVLATIGIVLTILGAVFLIIALVTTYSSRR